MFFYEGYTCPVCGKAFEETDDIVACPECGAPHHRECWQREGHCHYAADHGTGRQWSRKEAKTEPAGAAQQTNTASYTEKVCPYCGNHNPEFAEFCSRCGHDLPAGDWAQNNPTQAPPNYTAPPYNAGGYSPYGAPPAGGRYGEYSPYHVPVADPYGGVPHDETIDGEAAKDVVTAVGANSAYYLPRFYKMSKTGSKINWNWPAFLLTPYWLLYRKNYLAGTIVMVIFLARTIHQNVVLYVFMLPAGWTTMDPSVLMSQMAENDIYYWILVLLMFLDILIRVMFGLTGNYIYMRTTMRRVRSVRKHYLGQDSYYQHLATSGGISFLLGVSAYAILWFVSTFMTFII